MFDLIGWIVCGWIAGAIAQSILPPIENAAGWKTIALGVAGSIVGGVLYSLVSGGRYSPAGIVVSVVGAVVALAVWRWYDQHGGGL